MVKDVKIFFFTHAFQNVMKIGVVKGSEIPVISFYRLAVIANRFYSQISVTIIIQINFTIERCPL